MTDQTPAADIVDRAAKELAVFQRFSSATCQAILDEITRLRAREADLETTLDGVRKMYLAANKRLEALADNHFRNSEILAKRNVELQRKLDEAVDLLVCRQSTYPLNFHSPDWHTDRRDFLTSIRREG